VRFLQEEHSEDGGQGSEADHRLYQRGGPAGWGRAAVSPRIAPCGTVAAGSIASLHAAVGIGRGWCSSGHLLVLGQGLSCSLRGVDHHGHALLAVIHGSTVQPHRLVVFDLDSEDFHHALLGWHRAAVDDSRVAGSLKGLARLVKAGLGHGMALITVSARFQTRSLRTSRPELTLG
jgi:hypothetical protein